MPRKKLWVSADSNFGLRPMVHIFKRRAAPTGNLMSQFDWTYMGGPPLPKNGARVPFYVTFERAKP